LEKTYKMLHKESEVGQPLEQFVITRKEQGKTNRAIALELGITEPEFSVWIRRLGLRTITRFVQDREPAGVA